MLPAFIVSIQRLIGRRRVCSSFVSTAINLLRTRLQASGSPGHPTVYTGFLDVANQTLAREGWQGLYKGLVPTLAKVVPAVSISYVVSEVASVAGVVAHVSQSIGLRTLQADTAYRLIV